MADCNCCYLAVEDDILGGNFRSVSYFDFQTLKKATKNFHQNNLLGRGGFGPVYLVTFMTSFYLHNSEASANFSCHVSTFYSQVQH